MKKLSPEAFVRIWQEASNIGEVMRKTGSSYVSVTGRATRLRKKGVPLKMMPRGVRPGSLIDYAALAKLAKELGGDNP